MTPLSIHADANVLTRHYKDGVIHPEVPVTFPGDTAAAEPRPQPPDGDQTPATNPGTTDRPHGPRQDPAGYHEKKEHAGHAGPAKSRGRPVRDTPYTRPATGTQQTGAQAFAAQTLSNPQTGNHRRNNLYQNSDKNCK